MEFSYIVTMIVNVMRDLRVFMLFFSILVLMLSIIFDVIGRNTSPEYTSVGYFWASILTTLRLSLGDFLSCFVLIQ